LQESRGSERYAEPELKKSEAEVTEEGSIGSYVLFIVFVCFFLLIWGKLMSLKQEQQRP